MTNRESFPAWVVVAIIYVIANIAIVWLCAEGVFGSSGRMLRVLDALTWIGPPAFALLAGAFAYTNSKRYTWIFIALFTATSFVINLCLARFAEILLTSQ